MKSLKIPGTQPKYEISKIYGIWPNKKNYKTNHGIEPKYRDNQNEFGVVLARNYDFFIMFMEICFKVVLS